LFVDDGQQSAQVDESELPLIIGSAETADVDGVLRWLGVGIHGRQM
jgi:hypothetical protein